MKTAVSLADILRKFNVCVCGLIFPQYVSKLSSSIAYTHDFLSFGLFFFPSPSAFYFPFLTVIPLSALKIVGSLRGIIE